VLPQSTPSIEVRGFVQVEEDPGLVGNLLVERLIGANIYTVHIFSPFLRV